MPDTESCVFCKPEQFAWRTIHLGKWATSLVSVPWFRPGHCLVIPNRHAEILEQLTDKESSAIIRELGRLAKLLDIGHGTGIMQKHQPLQAPNGIKVNHLHFHIFPRLENEPELFPVPQPNAFEGFYDPTESKVIKLVEKLKI